VSDSSRPLGSLLQGVAGHVDYRECSPDLLVGDVQTDSRRVGEGDVFVAIVGEHHDGHAFADRVREAGAAAVVVSRGTGISGPRVEVDDTADAIAEIAANAYGRPGDHLRLAGITGTNGKTTAAHLVGAILQQAGRLHARLGTTGNWIVDHESTAGYTTPFPLELQALLADARARGGTDVVMEVSSHALAQGRARPLSFTAVGLTSFSQDHLDFHDTMEAYLRAKCRLASEHLRADGVAVAAVDDQPAATTFLAAAGRATTWRASRGSDPHAEIRLSNVEASATGMSARMHTPAGAFDLRTPLVGGFNLDNLMVATGLALGLGVELEAIEAALASTRGAPGRLERVVADGVNGPLVLVDYAHTPDAVDRAIAAARNVCPRRLVVLLGCGGDRDRTKRPLMGAVAAAGADQLWATSDNPRTEDPERILDDMLEGVAAEHRAGVQRVADRARAIAEAIAGAHDDDLVLILGKGHEDYQVLGTTKIHFDDREHAAQALARR
jgi:UDP-N-acetylmuramoyl-L-alanyl-D-glutamate--2,6-diaminopimelate ligase